MNQEQPDGQQGPKQQVPIRQARMLVWGPIYITLNLEKTPKKVEEQAEIKSEAAPTKTAETQAMQEKVEQPEEKTETKKRGRKKKESVNVLAEPENKPQEEQEKKPEETAQQKPDNSKKVTYVYNIIDHGLDCECIDIKGELLIRSALPTYRKISQGIEFEQITSNQIKLIITSRVLENYQEVFQGFSMPKATFRIWVFGYKFV